MPSPTPAGRNAVGTSSVLAGLTPLIPVPFLDDIVRAYFRRRMVRALAAAHGQPLGEVDVRALADAPGRGCVAGCLVAPLWYLLKSVFRKIVLFLEWKRAVDVASETYHFGRLLEHVLQTGALAPAGDHEPARVRQAIDTVLAHRGTSPIDNAVREAFGRSKMTVVAIARGAGAAVRGLGRRRATEQVATAMESVERERAREVAGVAAAIEHAVDEVPQGYLEELYRRLDAELMRDGAVTQGSSPSAPGPSGVG